MPVQTTDIKSGGSKGTARHMHAHTDILGVRVVWWETEAGAAEVQRNSPWLEDAGMVRIYDRKYNGRC